jgi:hypothetical protein
MDQGGQIGVVRTTFSGRRHLTRAQATDDILPDRGCVAGLAVEKGFEIQITFGGGVVVAIQAVIRNSRAPRGPVRVLTTQRG